MNIQASGNPRPKRGGKRSKKQRPKSGQTALAKAAKVSAMPVVTPVFTASPVQVLLVEPEALLGAADCDESVLLAGPASVPCTDEFTAPALEVESVAVSAIEDSPEPVVLDRPTLAQPTLARSSVAKVATDAVDDEAPVVLAAASAPAAPIASRVPMAGGGSLVSRSPMVSSAPATLPAPVAPTAPNTLMDRLLKATQDQQKWLATGLFYMMAGWIIVNSGWATEGLGYPLMLIGLLLPPAPYIIQHYLGRAIHVQQAQKTLARCEVRATRQGNNSLVYEIRSRDYNR